ncbi:MAG: T9SS type A sorting domain-containing protein [Ignavibacteriales bacterium]|nr:T9SS type A sorting domain-containing protein [Ignavibacteriales bacterium]
MKIFLTDRILVTVLFFCASVHSIAVAQCHTISISIWHTDNYYQLLDSYQTYTMPSDGLVTGFTFYGTVPGGSSGNITYRVYRMPEDTLLYTTTIFETGNGLSYYGVNFGYQSALYFNAGSTFKIRISANSLTVLNRLYYSNNNPYSGGQSSWGTTFDLASRVYTSVAPSLSLSASAVAFGTQSVGTPKVDSVTVTNPGCYTLTVSSVSVTNGQYSVTPTSASIAASGTQTFYITYAPSSATTVADTVTFVSDAPANATVKLPLSGTGIFQSQSNAGNGLTFNGTSSSLATSSNPSIANSSFTLEVWAKNATSSASGWFFGQGTGTTNQGLHIGYISTTGIRFGMWSDDLDYTSVTDAENWHHYAFVFNASTKFQAIYRDGALVASRTANNNFTGSGTFYVGRIFTGVTSSFNGTLDEARLWNVARSASEIRQNMHLSLAGNESGLLGYWRMDETSGTTAGDGTGHGYNATHQNSPTRSTSELPLGAGTSTHVSGVTNGAIFLSGECSLNLYEDFDNAVDVAVTKINSAPNQQPSGSSTLLDDRYFIVNVFGAPGTFNAGLTIYVPTSFTNNGTADPGNYTLYRRNSNSTGSWTTAISGLSVMNSDNITFNGLTSFSQFSVGTNDPLPVELVSFTASIQGTSAELKWKTATEVNNFGFEVERRVAGGLHLESGAHLAWSKIGFVEGSGTSNAPKEYSFVDKNLKAGTYSYRLKQIDRDGKFSYSQEVEVTVDSAPKVFALEQNYPNPFNPLTTIGFTIQVSGLTTLKVYDAIGREIATLVNEDLEAGVYHQRTFDAWNLAGGIYFARLHNNGAQVMRKMLLIK